MRNCWETARLQVISQQFLCVFIKISSQAKKFQKVEDIGMSVPFY